MGRIHRDDQGRVTILDDAPAPEPIHLDPPDVDDDLDDASIEVYLDDED